MATLSKVVKYKEWSLARNSKAYELYETKDFKALDKHLKQLDKNNEELVKRYTKPR